MFNRKTIEDRAENLQSLSEFQLFVHELASNFKSKPKHWENNNLQDYLDGLAMFTMDIKGYYQNNHPEVDHEQPSWRLFADILLAGRVYDAD